MSGDRLLAVEVAYALPTQQWVIALQVPEGTTLFEAAVLSRLMEKAPGLDLESVSLGVFGKVEKSPKTRVLKDGERVEIFRPLINDPKEARKARAAKVKETRQDNA
ncbi:MAG: RnfH family protein [Fluviicoccus sp.]|uniref:RnfH family protein n=1 Tax=Fluviicoccus sp. TaxID=2003552 RepID=UPI0027280436|nr:RnfH family protein [Fluviicoccus sp.]MDO8329785.1 RnfH family protein [Fluviicoccus sp.]